MKKSLRYFTKPVFLLVIPWVVFMSFGLSHLTKFETADEHYWIYSNTSNSNYWNRNDGRIVQYWRAIINWNLKETRINDKPGVTLAYVSGVGAWLRSNLDEGILTGKIPALSKMEKAEVINFYFRFPLLVFNGLFAFVLFWLIKKMTDKEWLALYATTFILLSPIIVGISQIINPDSLLWEFGFATILSYLIYLKENRRKYAVMTAVFLGLSLLTKYSSVIFFPFFFAVMILYFVENVSLWSREELTKKITRHTLSYLLIVFGSLAIYAVFLPDNLVEFKHFMKGSIGFKGLQSFFLALFGASILLFLDGHFFKSKFFFLIATRLKIVVKFFKRFLFVLLPVAILFLIINTLFGNDLFGMFRVAFDAAGKNYFADGITWKVALRQLLPLVFSLSPMVIFAIIYLWFKNFKNDKNFGWIIFIFSFFIVVFVAAITQQKVPLIIRYGSLMYPLIFMLAGIGVFQLFNSDKRGATFNFSIFCLIVFFGTLTLWQSKPFYFNYTNFLLPNKYIITDSWGYGGYEAAQYLNGIAGIEKTRVWSDYNGVCLFVNTSCTANKITMEGILSKAKKQDKKLEFGYFVSQRRGYNLSTGLWSRLKDDYKSEVIWNLEIFNRPDNFIKVYKN